jgi:transcription antitermination factor NusG
MLENILDARCEETVEGNHSLPGPSVQECGACPDAGPAAWIVACAAHRADSLAAADLRAAGYQALVPTVIECQPATPRRPARRVPALAFPGYVMVGIPAGLSWQGAIHASRSVDGILMAPGSTDRPATLAPAWVAALRARMGTGTRLDADTTPPCPTPLPAGATVEVEAGPLAAQIGRVVHAEAAGRVAVLLRILGRETLTILPARTVRRIA